MLIVVGGTLIAWPLWVIWWKYGELTEDTLYRFVFDSPLEKVFQLQTSFVVGFLMIGAGLAMIGRH